MPGITRQRYDQIQEAAMRLVASIGVTTLDAMTLDAKTSIHTGLYKQLAADQGIDTQQSRRHIYRAVRRQRYPDWTPPDWGGQREKKE